MASSLNDLIAGEWADLQTVMDGLPDAGVSAVEALNDLIADGSVEIRFDPRVRFKPVVPTKPEERL